jgi:hypothetical protein
MVSLPTDDDSFSTVDVSSRGGGDVTSVPLTGSKVGVLDSVEGVDLPVGGA